jgi:hypothetical protein
VAEDASHRGESLVTFARDPQQLANRDNLARALNGDDLATTCKPRWSIGTIANRPRWSIWFIVHSWHISFCVTIDTTGISRYADGK